MITSKEQMQARINQQSAEMIKNFREHVAEIAAYGGPDMVGADERLIFEAWAIQKIAALQVWAAEFDERLTRLATGSRLGAKTGSRQSHAGSQRVKNRRNSAEAKIAPAPSATGGKR
jgi:hypothetical protein